MPIHTNSLKMIFKEKFIFFFFFFACNREDEVGAKILNREDQNPQRWGSHCGSVGYELKVVSWGCGFNPCLIQWVDQGSVIATNCSIHHRWVSDTEWLWPRPAATALIWPLAQELLPHLGQKQNKSEISRIVQTNWGTGFGSVGIRGWGRYSLFLLSSPLYSSVRSVKSTKAKIYSTAKIHKQNPKTKKLGGRICIWYGKGLLLFVYKELLRLRITKKNTNRPLF